MAKLYQSESVASYEIVIIVAETLALHLLAYVFYEQMIVKDVCIVNSSMSSRGRRQFDHVAPPAHQSTLEMCHQVQG